VENSSPWEAKAREAALCHPLMMAAWHVADLVGNLAIRLQDAIEARLREAAGAA
jgi:hypothetical protein